MKNEKRLFFAFVVETNWPGFPEEHKLITQENRHLTVLFLGNQDFDRLESLIDKMPKLSDEISVVGQFNKCIFLPQKEPRLVAWQIDFFEKIYLLKEFQKKMFLFFKENGFDIKNKNNFLPHITICRNQFDKQQWEESFKALPLYIKGLHLFESLGNSQYKSVWQKEFIKPFEEIHHTADIAYIVKGKGFDDLLLNAFTALSFKDNQFLNYKYLLKKASSIDDVIINLNELITKAEIEGKHLPFKAVSFHSDIETKDNILHWEMIVDV